MVVEVSNEEGGKERAPRRENKDRKSKEVSVKGSKAGKKEKPSRAERGYANARGPKKKDDWQAFFKERIPNSHPLPMYYE